MTGILIKKIKNAKIVIKWTREDLLARLFDETDKIEKRMYDKY